MKKLKFKQAVTKPGSVWTDWINPVMTNYHLECCDCGLVHTMNFVAVEVERSNSKGGGVFVHLDKKKYKVMFKVRRNEKYTKQQRLAKKKLG